MLILSSCFYAVYISFGGQSIHSRFEFCLSFAEILTLPTRGNWEVWGCHSKNATSFSIMTPRAGRSLVGTCFDTHSLSVTSSHIQQCHPRLTHSRPRHHHNHPLFHPHQGSYRPHLARASRQLPDPHHRRTAPVSQIQPVNPRAPSSVIGSWDPRSKMDLAVTRIGILQKERRSISSMLSRPPKAAKRATSHMSFS
jgi:hypothetical protein